LRRTAWWAMQDSNLQPNGYDATVLTKVGPTGVGDARAVADDEPGWRLVTYEPRRLVNLRWMPVTMD
jgi:hypothetical protein